MRITSIWDFGILIITAKNRPWIPSVLRLLRQWLQDVFPNARKANCLGKRYVLNWAGKSDAFKVLQSPFTKTLVPAKEERVNFDTTQNIFIEGGNLEVP